MIVEESGYSLSGKPAMGFVVYKMTKILEPLPRWAWIGWKKIFFLILLTIQLIDRASAVHKHLTLRVLEPEKIKKIVH